MTSLSDSPGSRTYSIGGHQATVTIIERNRLPSGAVEVTVRTGCPAPDGKIHYQTNTTSLMDEIFGKDLEVFMENGARWLQKLL